MTSIKYIEGLEVKPGSFADAVKEREGGHEPGLPLRLPLRLTLDETQDLLTLLSTSSHPASDRLVERLSGIFRALVEPKK